MDKMQITIDRIADIDKDIMRKTQERLDLLTKPQGSLGRLEELAKTVTGITANENPSLKNKVIFTLAADHGVAEEGVSAFPQEVTLQMVYNFLNGGAGINVLAKHIGAKVVVVDMGVAEEIKIDESDNFKNKKVALGTKNMTKGPAMSRDEAIKSIECGIELVEEELKVGLDIVGIGEMGIGNTTAASAISCTITKKNIVSLTGRGTGINDAALRTKQEVIQKALLINKPNNRDGLDILSKVGGFEIGGLCGIILGASANKIPVVIDGFISTSAALIASIMEPKTLSYMIAAHSSVEPGHQIILNHLGLKPLLDLDLRLGEGTGAALGIGLIESGIKILKEMATFKESGVTEEK